MPKTHEHGGKSSESFLDKNLILRSLNIQTRQHVLDAGCGNGYMAKEFSEHVGSGGKVYAIDSHKSSISELKQQMIQSNITVILGDVTKPMAIQDTSVDLVYLSTVLHGFDAVQVKAFVREVKRILKPAGVLAVVEINKNDTPFGPPMDIRYSPEEMIEAIDLDPETFTAIGDYFYMQTFTQ